MNASERPRLSGRRQGSSSSHLSDPPLELQDSRSSTRSVLPSNASSKPSRRLAGLARHTLGLLLLLLVVFAWTASNFMGSSIFADNTYAKPFFLTYFNTTCFIFTLVPVFIRSGYQRWRASSYPSYIRATIFRTLTRNRNATPDESQAFLKPDDQIGGLPESPSAAARRVQTHLGLIPTARLALAFCILWFAANYFAMACLQYTTVASTTILTSTSSIWTLLIGACTNTERFTLRKLLGVLASFIGIVLVSHADLTAPQSRPAANPSSSVGARSVTNSFPAKSASELFLGDTLAFLSAIIYGAYTITLKRTTVRCAPLQLNMPLFFGLVGLCNAVLLFPLFPLLHYTHLEPFQLPPTPRIWKILAINSGFSLFSDLCWAYAMVLTSPLVVTVGLSLTIPLSLVGEIVLQGRKEGWVYWLGALVVVGSFVFVDREEVKEEREEDDDIVDAGETLGGSEENIDEASTNPGQDSRNFEDLPR